MLSLYDSIKDRWYLTTIQLTYPNWRWNSTYSRWTDVEIQHTQDELTLEFNILKMNWRWNSTYSRWTDVEIQHTQDELTLKFNILKMNWRWNSTYSRWTDVEIQHTQDELTLKFNILKMNWRWNSNMNGHRTWTFLCMCKFIRHLIWNCF